MKKLLAKLFGSICGVSTETRGAGLGRGTNRGSNLEWWKTLAKLKPALVVLALAGSAYAGDREHVGFSGVNASRVDRSTEMSGGGWGSQTWTVAPRDLWGKDMNAEVATIGDFMNSVVDGARRVGGWFSQGWDTHVCCSGDWAEQNPYGGMSSGSGDGMRTEPGPGGY